MYEFGRDEGVRSSFLTDCARYAFKMVFWYQKQRIKGQGQSLCVKNEDLTPHIMGFTLIEVMIAILILSVGMMAMALLQVTAIRGGSFANQVTQASIYGQDKIEELKNTSYNSIISGNDAVTSANGIIYNRSWTVAASLPYTSSKTISLSVSWTGPNRQVHSVQFSTIVSK